MTDVANYQLHGNVAIIQLNNPPVNGLSQALRQSVLDYFNRATADINVTAIVIISAAKNFCGGADIREFGSDAAYASPTLGDLCIELEESRKPIVAAIDGVALGGGFELALACDYRLATSRAKFALPEVSLGIIPGAGGTQRLPRISSIEFAMEMILTGKTYSAAQIMANGALDKIAANDDNLLQEAVTYACDLVSSQTPVRDCADMTVAHTHLPADYFETTRIELLGKSPVLNAHHVAVEALQAACKLPFSEGLQFQERLVKECMDSPEARALQHLFFAEKEVARVPGLNKDTQAREINSVAIIGAGTMGSGIAINFLRANLPVTLIDSDYHALEKGLKQINKSFSSSVSKGRLDEAAAQRCLEGLGSSTDIHAAANANLVIEAVIENMDVKCGIFKTLGELCHPTAILASNTSTLNIDEIAEASGQPENCLGMHFFSPAHVMRLLEVVNGAQTSPETLKTALQVARTIGKTPVVAGVCWGFIGNRMVEVYGREVARLILEGASPARIDAVLEQFGLPMGLPIMLDMAGMDVGYYTRQGNREALYGRDPTYAAIYDRLYDLGRFGQKTGRGFYRYEDGVRLEDEDVVKQASELAHDLGVPPRNHSDAEILERCLLALINEGARILEDGIALRSGDIDIVYCLGYGFPNFHGGPMQYADELGLNQVLERIHHYRTTLGEYGETWFQPAPLLQELAAANKQFGNYTTNLK